MFILDIWGELRPLSGFLAILLCPLAFKTECGLLNITYNHTSSQEQTGTDVGKHPVIGTKGIVPISSGSGATTAQCHPLASVTLNRGCDWLKSDMPLPAPYVVAILEAPL